MVVENVVPLARRRAEIYIDAYTTRIRHGRGEILYETLEPVDLRLPEGEGQLCSDSCRFCAR